MQIRRSSALVSATVLAVATLATGASAAGAKSEWQVVRSPGGQVAALAASSFSSGSDGWAVGSSGTSLVGNGIDTLIEHWDGSTWKRVPSPRVPQSNEALTGVSSTGPNNAWAVGWQDPYGTGRPHALLLHWDGQTWSTGDFPVAGIANAVDARTPGDVWAVGINLFLHFDGSAWSSVAPPRPGANPLSVTALSRDDVWAAGTKPDDRPGYRHPLPYAAHWNGKAWSDASIPDSAEQGVLSSVSAVSPSDVWAVGSIGAVPSSPYALHFDGTRWQQVTVPSAGEDTGLSGVTAVASSDVWAVGHQEGHLHSGFAVWRTVTEQWDGTAWEVVKSRDDSRHDNFLAAADSSGGRVWAFGGDGGTLVERR